MTGQGIARLGNVMLGVVRWGTVRQGNFRYNKEFNMRMDRVTKIELSNGRVYDDSDGCMLFVKVSEDNGLHFKVFEKQTDSLGHYWLEGYYWDEFKITYKRREVPEK